MMYDINVVHVQMNIMILLKLVHPGASKRAGMCVTTKSFKWWNQTEHIIAPVLEPVVVYLQTLYTNEPPFQTKQHDKIQPAELAILNVTLLGLFLRCNVSEREPRFCASGSACAFGGVEDVLGSSAIGVVVVTSCLPLLQSNSHIMLSSAQPQ